MRFYPSIGDRYITTLEFIEKVIPGGSRILDLGTRNKFTELLTDSGFILHNTGGEDLDENPLFVRSFEVDAVTALEILEHLVSPYVLLKNLPSNRLVATVPLRLWFAKAYNNSADLWDRHYHEFEDWQFDWLLEKAGWKIIERRKWTSPSSRLGFRTILRWLTPRYYGVYAER
ncbi:MAG TPA: hypothetical protein VMW76_06760 [Bacteroidales bacterium]|nr:hypothetical protein [Bacteroidales bacterium]